MNVLGLDLSLTGTGIARATAGQTPRTSTYGTKPSGEGRIADRGLRLRTMVTVLWPFIQGSDLVVIEQPAYAKADPHTHDRSGLWWLLVARATGHGIPVVEVAPNTLKVYATGRGRADKDAVLAAVVRRYLDVEVRNNNEADALVLACMGLRALGQPYDRDLPQTHSRAMAAPAWPQQIGADRG